MQDANNAQLFRLIYVEAGSGNHTPGERVGFVYTLCRNGRDIGGEAGYKQQFFFDYSNTGKGVYFRQCTGGTWGNWSRCDNFGCNTPADLASLLGGGGTISDANLALSNTCCYCSTACINKPISADGFLYTFQETKGFNNKYKMQIFWHYSIKNAFWMRAQTDTTWGEWKQIALDIPLFYKNYADLSSLASALGVIFGLKNIRYKYFVSDDVAREAGYPGWGHWYSILSVIENGNYSFEFAFRAYPNTALWFREIQRSSSPTIPWCYVALTQNQ